MQSSFEEQTFDPAYVISYSSQKKESRGENDYFNR